MPHGLASSWPYHDTTTVVMSAGFCPYRFHPRVRPDGSAPSLITHVRAFVIGSKKLEESSGGGADCHSQVRVCASEHRSDAWLGLVWWLWRRAMLCLWCSQASVVGAASVPAVLTWWCAGRPVVTRCPGIGPLDRRHAHRQPHVGVPSVQDVPSQLGDQRAGHGHRGG